MKGLFLACALALAPINFQKPTLQPGDITVIKYLIQTERRQGDPQRLLLIGDVEPWVYDFIQRGVDAHSVGYEHLKSFSKTLFVPLPYRSLYFRVVWMLVSDGMNLMFEVDRLLGYGGYLIVDIVNSVQCEEWLQHLGYIETPIKFHHYTIWHKPRYDISA